MSITCLGHEWFDICGIVNLLFVQTKYDMNYGAVIEGSNNPHLNNMVWLQSIK